MKFEELWLQATYVSSNTTDLLNMCIFLQGLMLLYNILKKEISAIKIHFHCVAPNRNSWESYMWVVVPKLVLCPPPSFITGPPFQWKFLSLMIFLLWWKSHNTKYTSLIIFNCTVQWHYTRSTSLCYTCHHPSPKFFIFLNWNSVPIKKSPFPLPSTTLLPLASTTVFSDSMNLTSLGTSIVTSR